jgi:hypothetical protein
MADEPRGEHPLTAANVQGLLAAGQTSRQAFPARAVLLIFWVGFLALFRGISDIVVAFEIRSATHV